MLNELFLATAQTMENRAGGGETIADKRGNLPIILDVIAGKCPFKRVINGTVAKLKGIEAGKTYLMKVTELAPHSVYGSQYQFDVLTEGPISPLDIVKVTKELGEATIVGGPAAPKSAEEAFAEAEKAMEEALADGEVF